MTYQQELDLIAAVQTLANEVKENRRQINILIGHVGKLNRVTEVVKNKSDGCPKCGGELYDCDENVLLSLPPKRKVACRKCVYNGFRLA